MSDWQLIDTAPEDQRLLLWRPSHPWAHARMVMGRWEEDSYATRPRPYWRPDTERMEGKRYAREHQPTHWMLPDPPEAA